MNYCPNMLCNSINTQLFYFYHIELWKTCNLRNFIITACNNHWDLRLLNKVTYTLMKFRSFIIRIYLIYLMNNMKFITKLLRNFEIIFDFILILFLRLFILFFETMTLDWLIVFFTIIKSVYFIWTLISSDIVCVW